MPAEQLQLATDYLDTRQLLEVLVAVKKGDFSVRMPLDKTGVAGKIADTLNDIIELQQRVVQEDERISVAVGKQGKITERASVMGSTGDWAAGGSAINGLIGDLIQPTKEMEGVIGAVVKADLTKAIAAENDGGEVGGEFLQPAEVVNAMVDQLRAFASEVTRVAREVGTEGKLGGQAVV